MVDVLVRTYNSEKTIERCLNSIFNQTYKKFRVVVRDDDSNDGTVEIIKNKFPQVLLYQNTNTLGVGLNRKRIFQDATSPYICFVDADDWIDENYLEVAVYYLASKNFDVIKTGKTTHFVHYSQESKYVSGEYETTKEILIQMNYDFISNYVFKRELLNDVIWFDKSNCEDGPIAVQLAEKCQKLFVTNKTCYHWNRQNVESTSFKKRDYLWILNCFHSALFRYAICQKYNVSLDLDKICTNHFQEINHLPEKTLTEDVKHCIQEIANLKLNINVECLMSKEQIKIVEKPKVAVCAIAKNENLYIREWVEWYKHLGVDAIFLFDNNEIGGEQFEDVIGDYIDSGFVTVIDRRGEEKGCVFDKEGINLQTKCYYECYENESMNFDWICFFDIDEFLTFRKNGLTLKGFLRQDKFDNFDTICVSWEHFDDNNQIYPETRPVMERFTHISKIERYGIKSIVRTGKKIFDKTLRNMIHCFRLEGFRICYVDGTPIEQFNKNGELKTWWLIDKQKHLMSEIVLNHYKTKCLKEYFSRHVGRHWGTSKLFTKKSKSIIDCILDYFMYNELTKEKIKFCQKMLDETISKEFLFLIVEGKNKKSVDWELLKHKLEYAKQNVGKFDDVIVVNNIKTGFGKNEIQSFISKNSNLDTNVISYEIFTSIEKIISEKMQVL